jgi:hypothetical protein
VNIYTDGGPRRYIRYQNVECKCVALPVLAFLFLQRPRVRMCMPPSWTQRDATTSHIIASERDRKLTFSPSSCPYANSLTSAAAQHERTFPPTSVGNNKSEATRAPIVAFLVSHCCSLTVCHVGQGGMGAISVPFCAAVHTNRTVWVQGILVRTNKNCFDHQFSNLLVGDE